MHGPGIRSSAPAQAAPSLSRKRRPNYWTCTTTRLSSSRWGHGTSLSGLLELHDAGELRTDFDPLQQAQTMTLPYHAPCQQRAHRVGKPALEIMALIPDLDVRESQARCCGIAGTYGYKREKYQIAMDVGQELFSLCARPGAWCPLYCLRFRDLSLAAGTRHQYPQPASHRNCGRGLRTV